MRSAAAPTSNLLQYCFFFFFNDTATTEIYTLSLHDALPILFIAPINTSTGIGYAAISFAFAVGQLMWGVAMPVAGALAERWGLRRVMLTGALMVAAATAATPLATSTTALVILVGIFAACGSSAMGPGLLLAAADRLIPEAKRNVVTC